MRASVWLPYRFGPVWLGQFAGFGEEPLLLEESARLLRRGGVFCSNALHRFKKFPEIFVGHGTTISKPAKARNEGAQSKAAGFPSPHSRSEWRGGVRGGGRNR